MPRTVGLTRASTSKQIASPEVQAMQILEGAEYLGLPRPEILHEPLGTSGVTTRFFQREQGRKLWYTLNKDDTLIVTAIGRLGRNARDIRNTIDHFCDRGVRIIILDLFGGKGVDVQGPLGQIIIAVVAAMAQMEAEAISERTRNGLRWRKETGMAYTNRVWGKKKVPLVPEELTSRGKPRCRLEWNHSFLKAMADFVHRLRMGEKPADLIEEFRASHQDWRGKPFMAAHDREGKMYSPSHPRSKNLARKWAKTFVRLLHGGELPAPFGTPGIVNPVDRGLARNNLRWINRANFTIPQKRKPKAEKRDDLDRSGWERSDWQRWWADIHADSPGEAEALDVESLKAEIKGRVEAMGLNGNGSHVG